NPPAPGSRGMVVAKGHKGAGGTDPVPFTSYSIEVNPNMTIRCFVSVRAAGAALEDDHGYYVDGTVPITQGEWTHLACVYDGTIRPFVDGVADETASHPGTISYYLGDGIHDTTIGSYGVDLQFFDGDIDEIAIFGRALTSTEIRDHYYRH